MRAVASRRTAVSVSVGRVHHHHLGRVLAHLHHHAQKDLKRQVAQHH
jgi:hypothetical protein